ncbi:D-ribose pyranase [Konateibacter massiliensis]|uniref:D-ribose pyranase n=1 Tax=Konateibacter massiliensis TaxID=2002841 RepID=UPI000C156824|nr:D-ribose pyranase [Konateibacter massiliensis]
MKRTGIIHGELAKQIAQIGHQDLILVCNAGLAVPNNILTIDLAITAGTPDIDTVLKAMAEEMKIEYYFIPEELREEQKEKYEAVKKLMPDAKEEANPFIGFKSFTRNVKFAVRTGDMTPYANYILRAGTIIE